MNGKCVNCGKNIQGEGFYTKESRCYDCDKQAYCFRHDITRGRLESIEKDYREQAEEVKEISEKLKFVSDKVDDKIEFTDEEIKEQVENAINSFEEKLEDMNDKFAEELPKTFEKEKDELDKLDD